LRGQLDDFSNSGKFTSARYSFVCTLLPALRAVVSAAFYLHVSFFGANFQCQKVGPSLFTAGNNFIVVRLSLGISLISFGNNVRVTFLQNFLESHHRW